MFELRGDSKVQVADGTLLVMCVRGADTGASAPRDRVFLMLGDRFHLILVRPFPCSVVVNSPLSSPQNQQVPALRIAMRNYVFPGSVGADPFDWGITVGPQCPDESVEGESFVESPELSCGVVGAPTPHTANTGNSEHAIHV